jgi:hypothetical protein
VKQGDGAGPRASSVALRGLPGDEIRHLYREKTDYGFAREPEPGVLEWMMDSTWSGRFSPLTMVLEGRLRGWAMTRTRATERGFEVSIVEVFAPRPDLALYAWMVSAAATLLMAGRPVRIDVRASCPWLQSALLANRFRAMALISPVHVWPEGAWDRAALLSIPLNHSDPPLLPYACGKSASSKPAPS